MTVLILGAGSIDSQLEKSICTFPGSTCDTVDPAGGGGLINSQLEKSVCTFAGITCDSVGPGVGGRLAVNLRSQFAPLLGLPVTLLNLGGGGLINSQLEKSVCTFAGITCDTADPGRGLIDSQLEKSVCIFAGITCDSVDPGRGH